MIYSIEEGIFAIIPRYTDRGDSTYIYTSKGVGRTYGMSMRTFLKRMYFFYAIDLIAQKNRFKKMGIYQNAPIVIRDQVFIKVRVRRPIGKSDGAYGYVNVRGISKIGKKDGKAVVILNDGFEIKSLDSYETLSKNLVLGLSLDVEKFWN